MHVMYTLEYPNIQYVPAQSGVACSASGIRTNAPCSSRTPAQASLPHLWPQGGGGGQAWVRAAGFGGIGPHFCSAGMEKCRERKEGLTYPWIQCQVVFCLPARLIERPMLVAFDPVLHPFQKSGDELLQHHEVYYLFGPLNQQPPLAGVSELLGECGRSSTRSADGAVLGMWLTCCKITHFRSRYFSMLVTSSCWARS